MLFRSKAALRLHDGSLVETVLLKPKPTDDWSVCVSTQVGCAMACTFCATGLMGLRRNLSAEEISEYELAGGGGTMFECMFEFLKDNDIQPDKLVVFTDGYPCGSWGDPNWCDTVWIIHGDRNPNPPFGVFALYDDHR